MRRLSFLLFFWSILLLIISIAGSCVTENNKALNNTANAEFLTDSIRSKFPIQRGVNISHWLSQNPDKSAAREQIFTEADVEFLSQKGFDHIRLPFDEEHLWDVNGNKQPEAFVLLHKAMGWCAKHNLRVILDFHIIRSHYFNNKTNLLWQSKKEQDWFISMWRQLSDEFGKYPINMLAYELLNEAVADNANDWNMLIAKTVKALRQNEPSRMLVIGSNRWQSPGTFNELVLPENDNNIILSFHFYAPMIFTHYKAHWMKIAAYEGAVAYPGQAVLSDDLSSYSKDIIEEVNQYNGFYTKDTLQELIQEAIVYARKHKLQLYCGEFGVLPSVRRTDRLNWYKDVRYIFETNNISWSSWDYRGAFAIFHQNGSPDEILISTLTSKEK